MTAPFKFRFGGVELEGTGLEIRDSASPNHDSGDEDDGPPSPRCWTGRVVVTYPRSWREERVRPLPDHDDGDEDPWQPLCELSVARLHRRLL